jgi:hypothetical protein
MARFRVLSVAAASGRIAYVCFEDRVPLDWALSRKASRSPEEAALALRRWIALLAPDVVINEKVTRRCRKGARTIALIEALTWEAAQHGVHDIAVERRQLFANKYEEAAALAERFSELAPLTPKPRRIWDKEPLKTTYFEAAALALAVIDGPAEV